MSEPLNPLDPDRDYSRSAEDAHYAETLGWRRNKGREHRTVDIPFWTAPPGYCRWCGEDVQASLKSGKRDTRVRWHGACSTAYNALQPAAQRRRLWDRELGECAGCGRFCPRGSVARVDTAPRDLFRIAHNGTHYRLWACDHIVPLIDGGPNCDENLQLLCLPCHKAKTAAEATSRAAARTIRVTEPTVQMASLFDVQEVGA